MRTATRVEAARPCPHLVPFDDGARSEVGVGRLLTGEMFDPSRDHRLSGQATVDPVLGTVVWPNGADLAPECPYEPQPRRAAAR